MVIVNPGGTGMPALGVSVPRPFVLSVGGLAYELGVVPINQHFQLRVVLKAIQSLEVSEEFSRTQFCVLVL